MFVVIQKVQLKKPNTNGAYKEYEVQSTTFSFDDGDSKTSYSYYPNYDSGRFERSHQEAYKISIHQSYRDNGKVKKKQCVIATIGYYAFADDWGLYDLMESGLDRAAAMFGKPDNLYDLVEAKVKPLRDRIQKEYHKTEEHKVAQQRDKVQKAYQKAKAAFAKKYSVSENEYDFCFNVFGEVMNQPYLDQIIQRADAYSSYYTNQRSTHSQSSSYGSGQNYSSYFPTSCSTYTDDEKLDLKKFYKTLAQKFHPDMNPGADTTKAMQLLNKLKEDWKI